MSRHPGNQISELLCSRDYQSRRRAFLRRTIRLADTRNPAKALRRRRVARRSHVASVRRTERCLAGRGSACEPVTIQNIHQPDSAWYSKHTDAPEGAMFP